jgi:hypothetical protein
MRIFRATVLDHIPSDNYYGTSVPGTYRAYGEKGIDEIYYVQHTSPFYSDRAQVGFLSIPPKDSMILVCQTDDRVGSQDVFYLATIAAPQLGLRLAKDKNTDNTPPSMMEKVIDRLGQPSIVSLAGPTGHNITLSHNLDENSIDSGVYLRTSGGKLVRLEDGPEKNHIVIKTADGILGEVAAIELQEKPNPKKQGLSTSYTITMYATGQINMISQNSNINMRVEDGGQINIENTSTGLRGAYIGDPTCGTINIKSPRGDINIIAGTDPVTGSVGPGIPNPIAAVNITAAGGPATSLNVHTDGILNLSGGSGVRIAGGDLRLGITGVAPVVIEGVSIDLNTTG